MSCCSNSLERLLIALMGDLDRMDPGLGSSADFAMPAYPFPSVSQVLAVHAFSGHPG